MAVRDVVQAAAGVGGGGGEYIEDVFSTYLYTGNSSTQNITNNIDLAGEGGLVWTKSRTLAGAANHSLVDTDSSSKNANGFYRYLSSNLTNSLTETTEGGISAFQSNGFQLFADGPSGMYNASGNTYASWTFRKAPKFFDVVTYTGDGTSNRQIPHNLGAVPGCIIIKQINGGSNWYTYHRGTSGTPQNNYIYLNTTAIAQTSTGAWGTTPFSDTDFYISAFNVCNISGGQFVAYLFAHDAGGFGDDGEQSVISCGSYTGNGDANGPDINLGWEPQWVMIKRADGGTGYWYMLDNMRGLPVEAPDRLLIANLNNAEEDAPLGGVLALTPTGFQINNSSNSNINANGSTYIYIAIRRGPMKTPESGTEVFRPAFSGDTTSAVQGYLGAPVDLAFYRSTRSGTAITQWWNRMSTARLDSTSTDAEIGSANPFQSNIGFGTFGPYSLDTDWPLWLFRRAPGFFDVVAYTGTDSSQTLNHNLGVAPEMIIVKRRNGGGSESWVVQHSGLTGGIGQGANSDYIVYLNSANPEFDSDGTFNFSPTTTTFSLQNNSNDQVNDLSGTYIAYLFASLPGVSKVGSYTGTGTSQNIDCGFSNGARFVLIKKTSNTGDWGVFDTARGITESSSPLLRLNNTIAEANFDYLDPYSGGFAHSGSNLTFNAVGETYIFLAIA